MGKYQPYNKYKLSEVRWIGKVPAAWSVIALKNLDPHNSSIAQTGPFGAQLHASDYVDDGIPLILIRNVYDGRIDDSEIPRITKEDACRLAEYAVKVGDIVFSRVGSIGRIAPITDREAGWIISGQMLRLRINSALINHEFLVWALSSRLVGDAISYLSVGSTRESINTDILRNLAIPIPAKDEQEAIVEFLDHETAKIDRLIARQERLIELLQEKRQAAISHAVTKGLKPDVPMKDSGVEWLGKVPAHWEASRLKYLVPGVTVGIVVNPSSYYQEIGVPCLRSLNISSGYIVSDQLVYISEESNEQLAKSKIYAGDVVVVRTGQAGTAAIVTKEFDGANCIDLLIVRKSKRILSEFLYHVIGSDRSIAQVKAFTVGAIQGHFNTSTLAELWLTCPPIKEQIEILKYLSKKLDAFDLLLKKARQSIALLQEHRTALISAAVTGKIDLRGWQKPNTERQETATAVSV